MHEVEEGKALISRTPSRDMSKTVIPNETLESIGCWKQ